MKRFLTNLSMLLVIAILAVVLASWLSYNTCKWHWFSRSGAIIVIIGVILSTRPLIRLGFNAWLESVTTIDGGSLDPTEKEIEEGKQSNIDAWASLLGINMAWIGTLIWAFGDLIGGLP